MSQLIIGTGPPRSGTSSLQVLLHHCAGADIYHEAHRNTLPFKRSKSAFDEELKYTLRERGGKYIGSVSFAWLPYIEDLQEETDANIVGVLRNREDHLESCLATQPDERIQSADVPMFPTTDKSPEEGWRWYRCWAEEQFEKHDIPTFRTSNLSDKDTQDAILHEAGISVDDRQYQTNNLHYNKRED